jgi:hypothetical protein
MSGVKKEGVGLRADETGEVAFNAVIFLITAKSAAPF